MKEDAVEEEIFVPLKDKRKMNQRKIAILVLTLIVLGTGMFFTLLQVMRVGGMPRFLFIALAIAIGYLIYEAITKLRQIIAKK